MRDFPSGPVDKNLSDNTGDTYSIPVQGTKIPHAVGQLSPRATAIESKLWSLGAIAEPTCLEPMCCNKRSHHSEKPEHHMEK